MMKLKLMDQISWAFLVHFTKVGSSSYAVVIFVFDIYDSFCEWLMI